MNERLALVTGSPLFGLTLCLFAYAFGLAIRNRFKSQLLNPLLIAILLVVSVLVLTGTSFDVFMIGGEYVSFLLYPATVALAVPLYRQLPLLKRSWPAVAVGILIGCVSSFFVIWGLGRLLQTPEVLLLSLYPKSVTTAIAIEVADMVGGVRAITALAVLVSGITGAIFGPVILRLCRVKDPIAKGVAIGTAAHALGTSRALELGETEGAFSGLAIGLAGIVTVFLVPALVNWLL